MDERNHKLIRGILQVRSFLIAMFALNAHFTIKSSFHLWQQRRRRFWRSIPVLVP